MAYGEALGSVGGSTKILCANRQLTDKRALLDRGSSIRIQNHALPSFKTKHANTRLISRRKLPSRFSISQVKHSDVNYEQHSMSPALPSQGEPYYTRNFIPKN